MRYGKFHGTGISKHLIWILPICMAFSCSGRVVRPGVAVERMIRAYGGPEKVELLGNYYGKGFMKNLSNTAVAESHHFDVYRKGVLYKSKSMQVNRGQLVDVGITLFDGQEGYKWRYKQGRKEVPHWEFEMLKYRFPMVLKWVQESGIEGEMITGPDDKDVYLLRYENGDDLITLKLSDKSWLLQEVEVRSKSDSTFSYKEIYGNYRKVEGVEFPNRYTGMFKGRKYYEYLIPVIEYGVDLPDSIFAVTRADTIGIGKQ